MGLFDRFTGASADVPPPANAPVTVKTADVSVRRKFLQKVYTLLTINFAITIGISCAFTYIQPVQDFLLDRQWLIAVAGISALVVLLVLVCTKISYPANLILMYVFVLAYSCMIGIIVSAYFERGWGFAVLQAFVATAAVFVSITAYILVTKKDFSFLYGFLGAALVVLIVLSLFSFLLSYPLNGRSRAFYFGISILGFVHVIPVLLTSNPLTSANMSILLTVFLYPHLAYASVTPLAETCLSQPLVMTGYLLFDTSMVITRYGPDQWLQAVISLYIDVSTLFLYLLNIFSFISD